MGLLVVFVIACLVFQTWVIGALAKGGAKRERRDSDHTVANSRDDD